MIENVTDGAIRWSFNVAAPTFEEAPMEQCSTVFSCNTYLGDLFEQRPYFVFVEIRESHLMDQTIPSHGCLVNQQLIVSENAL